MDEIEFRKRVYANPQTPDQEVLDAAGNNPDYQKILDQTQELDTDVTTMVNNVEVPAGLKEKLLAALRGGIKTVLIPKDNEKDLDDIPDNVKRGMEIIPVSSLDEVLEKALVNPLVPIEWIDPADIAAGEKGSDHGVVTH